MSALKDAELEEFLPRLEAELKSKLSSYWYYLMCLRACC
jgi:hypothetical protein